MILVPGGHSPGSPDHFPVIGKQHITYNSEHENLETYHDEKYGKNRQRQVIYSLEPFQKDINTGQNSNIMITMPISPK